MNKYEVCTSFCEVSIDSGLLLLSENTTEFYYLGEFETELWQIIKDKSGDYELLLEYLAQTYADFNLPDFEIFWNDLLHNIIVRMIEA